MFEVSTVHYSNIRLVILRKAFITNIAFDTCMVVVLVFVHEAGAGDGNTTHVTLLPEMIVITPHTNRFPEVRVEGLFGVDDTVTHATLEAVVVPELLESHHPR